jgi:hypothetical protein
LDFLRCATPQAAVREQTSNLMTSL